MSVLGVNPLLLGGADGDQVLPIQRSVRLRSGNSAYFNRTPSIAGSNGTFTWSGWVKRGALGAGQVLFGCTITEGNAYTILNFNSADTLQFSHVFGGVSQWALGTSQVFRDPSAWYHIVAVADTGNATQSDRVRLYVNGVRITVFGSSTAASLNASSYINSTNLHAIGRYGSSQYLDGYLTEINFIDGQPLTPDSFGFTNSTTGVWQPKRYTGTYGTNGFNLKFEDNSGITATTIGKDSSSNNNNWTPNGISITAGATYDSMIDTPTPYSDGGNNRGNYPTLLVNASQGSGAYSDGNLGFKSSVANQWKGAHASMFLPSGKFYFEATIQALSANNFFMIGACGIQTTNTLYANLTGQVANGWGVQCNGTSGGTKYNNNATVNVSNASFAGWVAGNTLQCAVDVTNGRIWFGKNDVWLEGNPSAGTGASYTNLTGAIAPSVSVYGTGVDKLAVNCGQRPFAYTPPTGFLALNSFNLPDSTILNGANHFATTTYTGNGTTQTIVNTGNNPLVAPFSNNPNAVPLQPDFLWIKTRSGTASNWLVNSVTGVNNGLISNLTIQEQSLGIVTSINSNGFSVSTIGGTNATTNGNTATFVAWQWKAGGTAVTNTAGSITSQVSANPSAGFSIVTYTGTGANATVGHGLNIVPSMIIVKNRNSGAIGGAVYHASLGATKYLQLFQTTTGDVAATTDNTAWNGGSPTFNNNVFSLGSLNRTNSAQQMVAYCFSEIAGYSKFGTYTGNGANDGPFVYLGFRPRFVLTKRSDASNESWFINDTSMNTYNVTSTILAANTDAGQATGSWIDILSNGFKIRINGSPFNTSNATYIYAAFAENPFKNSLSR
jgi:hypothetical protein